MISAVRYISELAMLLFISTRLLSHNQVSEIDSTWIDIKTQIQRRADLSKSMANLLSNNNKIDKRELQVSVTIANDLLKCIDTLKDKNKSSITLVCSKNNNLTKRIQRLLHSYEDHPKFKRGEDMLGLQMQLEGCENRLAIAKIKYNDVCRHLRRTDLYFDLDNK